MMHAAEWNPNPDVVRLLLNAGADAKVKDNQGMMALDYAENNAMLAGTEVYRQLEEKSR